MDFDMGFFGDAMQIFYVVCLNDGLTQNSTLPSKMCGVSNSIMSGVGLRLTHWPPGDAAIICNL